VIGAALVGLGGWLLTGRELVLHIPKLSRGGRDGSLGSMFLFGVSYAVASLSCTIGPFLAVTSAGRLRAALPYVSQFSGALLVVAGAYVAWYGWFEIRTLSGGDGSDPIVDRAVEMSSAPSCPMSPSPHCSPSSWSSPRWQWRSGGVGTESPDASQCEGRRW
jgi:hypothetical protein